MPRERYEAVSSPCAGAPSCNELCATTEGERREARDGSPSAVDGATLGPPPKKGSLGGRPALAAKLDTSSVPQQSGFEESAALLSPSGTTRPFSGDDLGDLGPARSSLADLDALGRALPAST